jgi:glycosyltransferase involved in cell wall biosynthesis
MSHDNVLGMMKYYDMHNRRDEKVKVIFLPCYLDGKDGIVDMPYYDVVLGNDLCIYPSYYEPWGYTPLEAVAFIEVPGWVGEPRKDLQERLKSGKKYNTPLDVPQVTHWLHNMSHDNVLGMMKYYDMHNRRDEKVKVIFLPCYLDGKDGIVDMPYYDVVLGNDLCIYPSYYEPWGYTPLEAVAFKVPCITTDLAGFGLWANTVFGHEGQISDGVKVIHRTDYNYSEVADIIKDTVADFSNMTKKQVDACRKNAGDLSKKALWSEFITYYYEAYDIALTKAEARKVGKVEK